MTDDTVPFEVTDAGYYRVIQPLWGVEPESMSVTIDGTQYRLSGYIGKDTQSKVRPDVLVYEFCEQVNVV
jgi:hypothetical protein